MTHYLTFSIAAAHVNNAKKELNLMSNIKQYKSFDANYKSNFNEVFNKNVEHGILTIYSINSALESIITILSKKLNCNETKFYERTKYLLKNSIITNESAYYKCIKLRNFRNTITHWENESSQLLGTNEYLPYMASDKTPITSKEKLISILTKENLQDFFKAFLDLINNICNNLDNEEIKYCLENIITGHIIYEI